MICHTLSLLVLFLYSFQASAAAGDVINNIATISFVSNGNSLVQESSPFGNTQPGIGNGVATSFTEDRLINFSVISTDATAINVTSLQYSAFLTFTVTNEGNAPQDFLLTALNTSPSPFPAMIDSFDPVSPMQVFVEGSSNTDYLLAEDTGVFIDELAVGATATVYVVAEMPAVSVGNVAAVALIAQVAEGGSIGQGAVISADHNGFTSPAGVFSNGAVNVSAGIANSIPDTSGLETVFNDPAAVNPEDIDSSSVQDVRANGQHSDVGVFFVATTASDSVTLNKSVAVTDAQGGTVVEAGSTLHYQIDVVVSGSNDVNNLIITDPIPANTTYVSSSLLLNGVTDVFATSDGNNVVVDLSRGGTVSVAPGTLYTITFDVTID